MRNRYVSPVRRTFENVLIAAGAIASFVFFLVALDRAIEHEAPAFHVGNYGVEE